MKKHISLALMTALGASLLLAACQSKDTGSNKDVPPEFKAALVRVWDGQVQMQQALAQDDLQNAKEAFQSMHADLHMMPTNALDSESRAYWDSTDEQIMALLHPLAATQNLDSAKAYAQQFEDLMKQTLVRFHVH